MVKVLLRSALDNRYGKASPVLAFNDNGAEIFFQLERCYQNDLVVSRLRRAARSQGIRFLKIIDKSSGVRKVLELQVRVFRVTQKSDRVTVFVERAGQSIVTFEKADRGKNENPISES
jgi:hypothetical protein